MGLAVVLGIGLLTELVIGACGGGSPNANRCRGRLDAGVHDLRTATDARNLPAAADHAARLAATIRDLPTPADAAS